MFEFDNTYFRELEGLYVPTRPQAFPDATLTVLNESLAVQLGLDVSILRDNGAAWFGGTVLPEGANPLAQAYAGHQFGGFSPQLGDGRAALLGELFDRGGKRVDLQLKGSGRTPFSRGGDGRAGLGPVLREYLMGEAMHALGVPTTRALAAVSTGDQIRRQTLEPGALLVRIASSHLRVGTVQFFAARDEFDRVARLVDYAIERHYPQHMHSENPAYALLSEVVRAQASLIARWMSVGFVHGVMNTDNCTLSGQTIDYGPCAFLDVYDPATVFSSIDHHRRYAYNNQPRMAAWNLTRLAEALLPLLDDDRDRAVALAEQALGPYQALYTEAWTQAMRRKLGLVQVREQDGTLAADLLSLMADQRVDFTQFFRGLSDVLRGAGVGCLGLVQDPSAFETWMVRWRQRLDEEARDSGVVATEMHAVNPVYIPRNHLVEAALQAAAGGDLGPFRTLLDRVSAPYTSLPEFDSYALPAPGDFGPYVTFCGT